MQKMCHINIFVQLQLTHHIPPQSREQMHKCEKDMTILVKNMSRGSSGEEKVSRSFSSCSSCLSICLRLFSRFSAETERYAHTETHNMNKMKMSRYMRRQDSTFTGTVRFVTIFEALKNSVKKKKKT